MDTVQISPEIQPEATEAPPPENKVPKLCRSNWKKYVLPAFVLILVLAIPLTIYLNQQEQDIRQKASETSGVTASVAVSPENSTTSCPAVITFTGTINSTNPGAVAYRWLRSDGANGPNESVVFDAPGSKTVTKTWELGTNGDASFNPYTGWMAIEIVPSGVTVTPSTVTPSAPPTNTPTPIVIQITPTPVYIQSNITCVSGQKTMNQLCIDKGYTKAVPVIGQYAAKSYLWKQCGGASVTSCNGIECTVRARDCTEDQGADFTKANVKLWGMQNPQSNGNPYDPSWIASLQPTAFLNPAQLINPACSGSTNPGWTVRVACVK